MKIIQRKSKGKTHDILVDDDIPDKLQSMFVKGVGPYIYLMFSRPGKFYAEVRWTKKGKIVRREKLHRWIMNETNPKEPVDHYDQNPLNNQRSNLRPASHSQNIMNQPARNSLGVKWVDETPSGKFRVRGFQNKKNIIFGVFESLYEAAIVAEQKQIEIQGVFACPTNPEAVKMLLKLKEQHEKETSK
jgi:hypothetical protein